MRLSERLPPFFQAYLAGRDTRRQLLDNSFWLVCDQLVRMAGGLLVGVWMTRYLGPERYGWLSYAMAIVGTVASFTSLGLNAIVVRELARTPQETSVWMGTAFVLRSASATVGFIICVLLAWLKSGPAGSDPLLLIVVGAGMIAQIPDAIDLLFQARGEARVSAWVRISACVLANILKAGLILGRAPVLAFAAAGVVELALGSAGYVWAARHRGWVMSDWRSERARAVLLLRESWPLAVSGLAIYAQAYADQVVIGATLGGAELGQYAAALRLVTVFSFVPMVLQTVAAPEITRARRDDETLYLRRLHGLYRLMFVLFLLTAVPLIVLGPVATRMLYGASYAGAAALVPWLAFRLFFTNFGVARSVFVTNEGLFRFALVTAGTGAVVNLLLNLLLVPQWGARGAIAASFASFGVTTFGLELFQPRARMNLGLMARAIFLPWRGYQR